MSNTAIALMQKFAEDTGLTTNKPQRRYLWTDAFATCNFLGFFKRTKENRFKDLAIQLVKQVHSTLGMHREDDERSGWLGSNDHPTKNGLRIGKRLPERKPQEPFDPNLEWNRDGQYFHYLTKWIHTLVRVFQVVKEEKYLVWAIDLTKASTRFIMNNRIFWKMSIDLSYPLVPSMGQYDPIDGYVTFLELQTVANVNLESVLNELERILLQINLVTTDPLGIGGLLFDTYRLEQMDVEPDKKRALINAAQKGLANYRLSHGLAFRELGLAIGLQAAKKMSVLEEYWSLIEEINTYWFQHKEWTEHVDINRVMLATSLDPKGFLSISEEK
ncbi:MAG: hypothetical protein JSW11_05195 [Candidatus Heimdallarchaeota archaeon]|nr:MAG: hypothetical protein JSW11_05195 [Candidatus Heimdallarchaeota archaeon]